MLKVLDLGDKGLIVLRFGERYSRVPSVAIPRSLFAAWSGSRYVHMRRWISVTGVLQTHRSGKYSTVQVLVKEASDLELLADEGEAKYRLGRPTRPAPIPPPNQAAPATFPTGNATRSPGQPGSGSDRWKITRDLAPEAPGWMQGASSPASKGNQQPAAAPASMSAPTPRGACPSCGWDDNMPTGAIMLQCSHCGIVSAAARWRPTGPARASGAAPSGPPSATAAPKSPAMHSPRSAPTPQPRPSPSVAVSTGSAGGGQAPPNSKGLLSRLARLLFGRSGA